MSLWWILVLASLACLLFKIIGYFIPGNFVKSGPVRRTADLLPAALLAGLIATGVAVEDRQLVIGAPLAGVATAAVLFWLRVPFLPAVVAAAVVTAALRLWTQA
ncbi:AzlD domain-containing protein [Mycolicibacterium baixiangningiae]|uniref:AzlD domain-containing protein n=1 Tax=Mycolicibacterium baixiangningiae TaxID=2761578 RepID=UPI001867BFBB|nr:AzlD domain-containing protein [Mycolicibacterium baixiangningiae]